ncbi:MAG: glycosyltransferase family 4 protein, partial [Pseudomonadota bacterium]
MARRENGAASGGGEPAGFPSLASLPAPTVSKQADTKPLDICVVTSEILGPIKNGGIGTATSALADHLAAHGHRVSVLYTQVWGGRPVCHEGDWDDWVTKLWEKGIRLIAIKHDGPWNAWREKSLAVRRFLESQPFNLVYLNEHHASGFYALLAKRAGLTPFKDQTYAVITHGSMEWVSRTNDQPLVHPNDIAMALMERRCVEWADAVIGPSAYLLRTYQSYGWTLPSQTFVQPYLLGSADTKTQRRAEPIDELVFFGRLEHRKGLWMFCQALDRLAAQGKTPNVTFMGRMTPTGNVPSGAFLLNRAADWPFRVRLLTEFGQEDALAYLKQPGKLAVMPSLADNSPCVVYEAIELGLPFVTCSGSGADEIIHPRDHKVALVEPTAEALADRLADCLENGAKAARLAFDPSRNQKAWEHWHATISAKTKAASAGVVSAGVASAGAVSDTKKSSKTQAPHLLLIDDPGEPLGQIFETIAENAKSFGSTGSISFLTPRQGDLGDWIDQILDLIAQGTAMDIRRVTTSNASQAVKGKACTVVTSVSARLAAPLIRHAADLVSRNKDTVFSYLP